MNRLLTLLRDQDGNAAIQYAIVAGILSLVVFSSSLLLREPVIDLYANMAHHANGALNVEPAAGPAQDPKD